MVGDMSAASAATSDRTVNKVAFCGALFAGVAYVGYKIVKTAFRSKKTQGTESLAGVPVVSNRSYIST